MPVKTGDPTPRHGDRGDSSRGGPRFPRTLTVAVSRQSGARGGSIAKRVSRKLGWQIVDQELMEFIAQKGGSDDDLSAAAHDWAEERLSDLIDQGMLAGGPAVVSMARVALTLGALGEAVLLGRGAGHVLPPANSLHVRIVAPRADRIAYMSQWLRLTPREAEKQVDLRDDRRNQYLLDHFSVEASDPIHYDLVLNSSLLGEELCAELITQAARAKLMEVGANDSSMNLEPI
jgi:hypothetical protein